MVALTCYAEGTHVMTDQGECRVEALKPGDLVRTARDEYKPVKWVGVRQVRFADLAPEDAARHKPVLFRRGCFGENLPHRDLLVSGPHAMAINDRLIPASRLVNGVSIVRLHEVEEVTYCHVELDGHEAIFAEGVTAESYLDIGNRAAFDNADALAGAPVTGSDSFVNLCYPPLYGGPELDEIRAVISRRAQAAFAAKVA